MSTFAPPTPFLINIWYKIMICSHLMLNFLQVFKHHSNRKNWNLNLRYSYASILIVIKTINFRPSNLLCFYPCSKNHHSNCLRERKISHKSSFSSLFCLVQICGNLVIFRIQNECGLPNWFPSSFYFDRDMLNYLPKLLVTAHSNHVALSIPWLMKRRAHKCLVKTSNGPTKF